MKKCSHCGEEYKANENIPDFIPEFMREKIKEIQSCDCLEKLQAKELEERESKLEEERKLNRVKKYKDISIIDKKFLNAKFENAEENKHIKLAESFVDKFIKLGTAPTGILFHGTVGTGKTYATSCIANKLMNNNKTVLVMNLGLYLNKLMREWAEAEREILDKAATCDLLIIDDFGAEKVSEFVREKVFNLIDCRYRSEKPCVITSNLDLKGIELKFGDRISDRLKEMCFPYEVKGASKREEGTREKFLEFIK